MPKNSPIQQEAREAWNSLHHNHAAYLQALIYVMQAKKSSDTVPDLARVYGDLALLTKPLNLEPIDYFRANLFFSQVTGIELFLQRVIRAVVSVYPEKIGSVQFKLSQALDLGSVAKLVELATDDYLNRLLYKRPAEYLTDMCVVLSISDKELRPLWPSYVEAKARRDVGIHNDWVCNETYLRKVSEVGIVPTVKVGDSLVPSSNEYMFEATDNLRAVGLAVWEGVRSKYA